MGRQWGDSTLEEKVTTAARSFAMVVVVNSSKGLDKYWIIDRLATAPKISASTQVNCHPVVSSSSTPLYYSLEENPIGTRPNIFI